MDNDRELLHALKLFEMRRRENLTVSCSRNDAYWTELKALLEQGLNDMEEVVECLKEKRDNLKLHAALGLKKKGNNHHDKKETSPILVGRTGSMILLEYEIGLSSKFQEEATHLDTLIKGFTTQSEALEKELKTLWIKGDRLLFTLKLSDQRARKNYEQYTNRFQSDHSGNNAAATATTEKHSQDLWLLECMYSVSAARSYEIKEECNKQLRFLFGRSKDVETRRQAIIFKTFQTFLSRQNELFGSFPKLSTVAMDRLTRVQADAGAGDNIATLLASRVEQEHDTVALNMMQKAQERAREREKHRLANETLISSSDDAVNAKVEELACSSLYPLLHLLNPPYISHHTISLTNLVNTFPPTYHLLPIQGAPTSKGPGASASMAAFFLATESFDTPPPLPFPLHSPFILESALFYKRSPSVIMASWTPVLVCLTRSRILHIFELDTVSNPNPNPNPIYS